MVEFQKGQRKVGWTEWAGREKCAEPCEPIQGGPSHVEGTVWTERRGLRHMSQF